MTVVKGVRARPGGRVILHFDSTGLRVEREPARYEWWLDDTGCFTSSALAVAFACAAGVAAEHGHPTLAVVLGILALPWALVVVARVVSEFLGEVLGYLMLACMVVCFPLLLVPAVRRRARAFWAGSSGPPRLPGIRVSAAALQDVQEHLDGDLTTFVLTVDGERTAYTTSGPAALVLRQALQEMRGQRTRGSERPPDSWGA